MCVLLSVKERESEIAREGVCSENVCQVVCLQVSAPLRQPGNTEEGIDLEIFKTVATTTAEGERKD